ncbi:ABC transporter ATP-binding protein [Methylomonas lenta]|uniref:ABC transporter ATP-binding protein n=1 Tax=Methylomonas lenta TaxID=980561 RepID=A0A177NE09_9GAMM|nr:ABC transporter ATP-binding protein [Methylomonas lenta]OAI16298.1 ABC transporter ATP-binding protein [Methylomonas lenta]
MAQIVLDSVSKQFANGTRILSDTSFTIQNGEFFVLIGPSGCGKSTLLNMIVGLEDISSGEIRVDGQVINDLDPKDRNMAMVFQSYAIYPHMTVAENIAFPLRLARLPKAEIQRKVAEAAALLELEDLLTRKPATLSGGQRQRVAMGRALVRDPVAFLLDEPLSNLDARLRVQMRGEIGRLQKRLGTTMIYVTHDQTEAMTLGDRVAVLNRGEVQQIGTPKQLYQTPANLFVAGFMGSPGMNFVPAEIKAGKLRLPFGETKLLECCSQMAEKPVIAGFRPEAVSCVSSADITTPALLFQATVDRVEWLGAELFVYADIDLAAVMPARAHELFKHGSVNLVFRLEPSMSVQAGQVLQLQLDLQALQLFDWESGCNLHTDFA